MDVRLLGKKNEGEGLGVAVLVDSAFAELKDKSDEQLAEAQRFLIDFMKKVARLKGVRIDRPHFLRSELRRRVSIKMSSSLPWKRPPLPPESMWA